MIKRQNSLNPLHGVTKDTDRPVSGKPRSSTQPPASLPSEGHRFFTYRFWSKSEESSPKMLPVVDDAEKYELIDTGKSKPINIPVKKAKSSSDNTPVNSI